MKGGQCVRLYQGDFEQETVFPADPLEWALRWQSFGAPRLHVVDLDAAGDTGRNNMEIVKEIARVVQVAAVARAVVVVAAVGAAAIGSQAGCATRASQRGRSVSCVGVRSSAIALKSVIRRRRPRAWLLETIGNKQSLDLDT